MLQIHLVFYQFDDGEDEVGIAQPTKYVVEDRQVFVFHAACQSVGKRCQHHAVDIGELCLDGACDAEGIVIGITGHTDDKVYVGGVQHLGGLFLGTHLGERRRITQPKLHILVVDFLLHATVVLEHEGIVGVGHDEHIEDATHHQIHERHVFQQKLTPFLWNVLIFHPICHLILMYLIQMQR